MVNHACYATIESAKTLKLQADMSDYDFSSGDITDYDAINAAIDALISPVGTISEISFSTATYPGDVVKKFKKIENIKVEFNDHKFKVIK